MKRCFFALLALFALLAVAPVASAATSTKISAADARLAKALGPSVRVSFRAETGKARFIGTQAGHPIARPAGLPATASPQAVARAFLARTGALFGIRDQARELRLQRVQKASRGRSVARFQQVVSGVPVLAGQLVVNMDARGNILSASGEALAATGVATTATASRAAASGAARTAIAKLYKLGRGAVRVARPSLWIYDAGLLGGPGPKKAGLVWRTEVTSPARADLRELVLVDARTGKVGLHFNQVAEAKNRKICNANNTDTQVPCTTSVRVEGQGATGVPDVDLAYDYAGIVYDFFKARFNRDSIDGAGMPLLQTVKYCDPSSPCPFENAFWNGTQMVYGDGYASADDVVGHEMMHGITERTSGLFYWFQSGAINESLSDVFGELIDLSDGRGNDSAGVKWKMGEDLSIGAIRDMRDPTLFNDPDRMQSPNYTSGVDDFDLSVVDRGGVHTNSGVNNKATFLMTDGGTFNGKTVTGLGITRVAAIYYEVDANILTSGSDYLDLYDGLYQACQNLVGTATITAANCTQVRNATLAVQMNLQPMADNSFPSVPEAPMCAAGQVPTDLFYDNMENQATGNWTKLAPAVGATNKWMYTTDYAASGKLALWTEDQTARSDTSIAKTTAVPVPLGKTTYARFSQATDWEYAYDWYYGTFTLADGGIVEYSTNGGTTWTDALPLFANNPYWGTLYTAAEGSDNPLQGKKAFTDVLGGYMSSRLNLTSLAGQSVKLRFRAGTDTNNVSGFFFGWLIDDFRIYTCATGSRVAVAPNLLKNPGFEWDDNDDGYADFWSQNTSALRTFKAPQHTGLFALRHSRADNGAYNVSQKVTGLTAGASYRAAGWFRIPTTASAVNFKFQVQFLNGAGAVIGTTRVVRAFTDDTAGAWVHPISAALVAPTGTAGARVQMVQNGLNAKVIADDFLFQRL